MATALCVLFAIFTLIPLVWIVVNSTKTQANIYESFGFWFARPFALFKNLSYLNENVAGDGTYLHWLLNTAFYAIVGAAGSALLSALAGYGFARFRFRGSKSMFFIVIATLLVPISALSLPLYLVYAKIGFVNSPWGLILPSMVTPVGVYLMRTFITHSVPSELLDAARIDGGGEIRIFRQLALPLMLPGIVTVFLFAVVGVWNNYFLPLLLFSKPNLYPVTVGLSLLSSQGGANGGAVLIPLVVIGGLIAILPLGLLFVFLQRYWRTGMLAGSLAN